MFEKSCNCRGKAPIFFVRTLILKSSMVFNLFHKLVIKKKKQVNYALYESKPCENFDVIQHNPVHSAHRRLAVDYNFRVVASQETTLKGKINFHVSIFSCACQRVTILLEYEKGSPSVQRKSPSKYLSVAPIQNDKCSL